MNAHVFIDTNVFLYAISDLAEEQEKATRARTLLLSENLGMVGPGRRGILRGRDGQNYDGIVAINPFR